MTGIADLYMLNKKPHSKKARERVAAMLQWTSKAKNYDHTRFVILSWKRTGSNLLCGILFNHPEIAMHNELFNPIDIFSYYRQTLARNEMDELWNPLLRDLYPEAFLAHVWTARNYQGDRLEEQSKAVGFKSFPDHWWDVRNESVFEKEIMEDFTVKKVVLFREDELAVYVSMKRAETTGLYMTLPYPRGLKIRVDPAAFQIFINNYRDTYRRRYTSTMPTRDTFRVSYEQLADEANFEEQILPLLWDFLGVDTTVPMKKLKETVKQAVSEEDLSDAIENYSEVEFAFRHTDVKHFLGSVVVNPTVCSEDVPAPSSTMSEEAVDSTWSILLPICARKTQEKKKTSIASSSGETQFDANRFHDLAVSCQYEATSSTTNSDECWDRLQAFADSLRQTSSPNRLSVTECIVGLDVDDTVFRHQKARIVELLPCSVQFVDIGRKMYGRVCKIWNHLANHAHHDFVVLLGDDVVLKDDGWQEAVASKFGEVAMREKLPFGAACVALHDDSFPGYPTFPVIHRWHLNHFGTLLPRQFVNQGGDPYLFELYSRFNAAAFATKCRLHNTIGGDSDARYKNHEINWKGQILRLGLLHLEAFLGDKPQTGVCVDIVIPSYRTNNDEVLMSILRLRCSAKINARFWLVVDNPDKGHLRRVNALADKINAECFAVDGNYFVTVLHYDENRGASFARNLGVNYSTADWTLFLDDDDDVTPTGHLLDAYVGALQRYPKAKVFVGNTELPVATNLWTKMLRTCNIMFFYGISNHVNFPPWGVTANLMVRGSRHNGTIQFKDMYPKTGGGEDIDFCFQLKEWYGKIQGKGSIIVGVPGAVAKHPWWNNGQPCYRQINGWAWGDSLCISQWPEKCFYAFPNWIEFVTFVLPVCAWWTRSTLAAYITAAIFVVVTQHCWLAVKYYPSARRHVGGGAARRLLASFGAGTIHTSQDITRVAAHLWRGHLNCIFRRVDWNDGQNAMAKLDIQLGSCLKFGLFMGISIWLLL